MTDMPDPQTLPTERLEHEVTSLAAHLAAATCRWLLLVAELDRREAWKVWGCKSMADWLSMRCGIALSTAKDQVRVARAMSRFPLTRAAFERGELSYSQVRAIVRLDAPEEHEAEVVALARHATGSHLERIVRSYKRASAADEERRYDGRSVQHHWDDDGCLVVRAKLTPEDGALFLGALKAAEGVSAETGEGVSAETPDDRSSEQRRADAFAQVVRSAVSEDGPAIPCEVTVVVEADGHGEIPDGPTLDPATVERLACDAAVVPMSVDGDGEALNLGRRSYRPNRAQRRAMARRDKRRCRFPGCPAQRYVDAHHVDWWTRDGGETNVEVLVTLCRHHHRLVHKRVIGVVADGQGGFSFVRADGTPIEAGEPVEGRAVAVTRHAEVDAMTAVPRWGGERLDMDLALTALFSWDA
ncbi:MAG: hypothetical protein JWN67_4450 [Actinomycetia bacterium]|nr:hypothetical protein [Actinomycetes bacterium]